MLLKMAIVASQSDPVRAGQESPVGSWQHAMKSAIRDPVELCRVLALPPSVVAAAQRASPHWAAPAGRWRDLRAPCAQVTN